MTTILETEPLQTSDRPRRRTRKRHGYHTVLVLSGGTASGDCSRSAYQPELITNSIADLNQMLEDRHWQPWWTKVD